MQLLYFYAKNMNRLDFIRHLTIGLTGTALFPRTIFPETKMKKPVLLEHFYIAGYSYYEGEKTEHRLSVNDRLQVKREKENPYDRKAVSLWYNNRKLGFVPRHKNTTLAKLLDQNIKMEVVIRKINREAAPWNRIFVDIVTHSFQ